MSVLFVWAMLMMTIIDQEDGDEDHAEDHDLEENDDDDDYGDDDKNGDDDDDHDDDKDNTDTQDCHASVRDLGWALKPELHP